jgi:hypothetical protein
MAVVVYEGTVSLALGGAGPAIICGSGFGGFRMSGETDEVLVQRMAASGDERAVSELYDR